MLRLHWVDVFAPLPLSGNPLAVIVCDKLPDVALMQALAAELNLSETTFVRRLPEANGAHRVRMFTPAREVDFAGHPILGTAWALRVGERVPARKAALRLALNVGVVPVAFEGPSRSLEAWFDAPAVHLGPALPPEAAARALGLRAHDIDGRWPVQVARAGTAALMVPLRSLSALRRARLDLQRLAPLADAGVPPLAYLFCAAATNPANQVSARFFFEANGVREDPATGNGAAFLGAYLLRHGVLGAGPLDLRIEQGADVGRPSIVRLRAARQGRRVAVSVGGVVRPVVRGTVTLAMGSLRNTMGALTAGIS